MDDQLCMFDGEREPPKKKTQEELRDEALAWLKKYRRALVARAMAVAVRIAKANGSVTSTEVLREMRESEVWRARVDAADRRFMGPVFRRKIWERVGWETTGSHARPVARWKLK